MTELEWCRANAPAALANVDDATLLNYMHNSYLQFVLKQSSVAPINTAPPVPVVVPTPVPTTQTYASPVDNTQLKRTITRCTSLIRKALNELGAVKEIGTQDAVSLFVRKKDTAFGDIRKHKRCKQARKYYREIKSLLEQINQYGYFFEADLKESAGISGFFDFFFDSKIATLFTRHKASSEIDELNRLHDALEDLLVTL